MNWQDDVVDRTLKGAERYSSVQLKFLLQRLEDYPECLPAIAEAVRDMGKWYDAHAAALEAEAPE